MSIFQPRYPTTASYSIDWLMRLIRDESPAVSPIWAVKRVPAIPRKGKK